MTGATTTAATTTAAELGRQRRAATRFAGLRDALTRWLPFGLSRHVPPTVVGFALLNGFTYALDLTLLWVLDAVLGVAYPLAVSIGYGTAFTLAFVLNRWLNFQVHGHVGQQTGRYVAAVLVNYLALILLLATALEANGVPGLLARLIAGGCEGVFMYGALRWFVFSVPRGRERLA